MSAASDAGAIRARILAEPGLVLDDGAVMAALLESSAPPGRNVVDLRGALVARLETRLDALTRTHRSVIAAAYENLAGVAQVHRAALSLIEAEDVGAFLRALLDETPEIVAVDHARLCLECEAEPALAAAGVDPALMARVVALPPLGVDAYTALGETRGREEVWLRPTPAEAELIWGEAAPEARSEALIGFDLHGRRGLAAFASEDPARFSPEHGADLVRFLGDVIARRLAQLVPA